MYHFTEVWASLDGFIFNTGVKFKEGIVIIKYNAFVEVAFFKMMKSIMKCL